MSTFAAQPTVRRFKKEILMKIFAVIFLIFTAEARQIIVKSYADILKNTQYTNILNYLSNEYLSRIYYEMFYNTDDGLVPITNQTKLEVSNGYDIMNYLAISAFYIRIHHRYIGTNKYIYLFEKRVEMAELKIFNNDNIVFSKEGRYLECFDIFSNYSILGYNTIENHYYRSWYDVIYFNNSVKSVFSCVTNKELEFDSYKDIISNYKKDCYATIVADVHLSMNNENKYPEIFCNEKYEIRRYKKKYLWSKENELVKIVNITNYKLRWNNEEEIFK